MARLGDNTAVTNDAGAPQPQPGSAPPINRSLPPDPAAYDAERNALARQRGLSAPYIAGGRDPEPDQGLREERFYLRLLVAMVVALILAGFVLGIIGNLITGG